MTEFVGAEHLIAKMLIENHAQAISTVELNKLGIYARQFSIEEKVGAVFLTSRDEVYSAITDYSDYFQCIYDEDHRFSGIKMNENKSVNDLDVKFIQYLPDTIMKLLDKAINSCNAG